MVIGRREALAAGSGFALTSLSGCLGFLGARPRDAAERTPRSENNSERPDTSSTSTSTTADTATPTTTEITEPEATPESESRVQPQTEPHAPGDASLYSGPIDSAPVNDWSRTIDDPTPGIKLGSVTLEMAPIATYVRDPMYLSFTDELQLSIAPSGDSFAAVGRFHLRTACDVYGIDRVYVVDRAGYVVLAYGESMVCDTVHESVGPWFANFTVTGELIGEFDTLTIQLRDGHINYPEMPNVVEVEQLVP